MATLPPVASLDTISAAWANSVITEVNANGTSLAVVTYAVVVAGNVTNQAGAPMTVYRIGKLCILDGMVTVAIPMTAEAIMDYGTIPAGVRPPRTINSTCRYVGGGGAASQINPMVVQTDGKIISVGPAQGAGSAVHLSTTCWTIP